MLKTAEHIPPVILTRYMKFANEVKLQAEADPALEQVKSALDEFARKVEFPIV